MELDTRPSARSAARTTFPRTNQGRPASPRSITGTVTGDGTSAAVGVGRDRREGETDAKTLRAIAAARAEFHIYRYPLVPVSREETAPTSPAASALPVSGAAAAITDDSPEPTDVDASGRTDEPVRFAFSRRTAAVLWSAAALVLLVGVAVFVKISSSFGIDVLGGGAVLMMSAIVVELRQRDAAPGARSGEGPGPSSVDVSSSESQPAPERMGGDFVEFRVPSNSDLRRYVLPPSFGLTIIAEQTMGLIAESNGWESVHLGSHHEIFDLDVELNRVANKAWRLQELRNDLGPAPETHSEGGNLRRQEDIDRAALALTERRVWESQNETLDAVYLSLVRRVTALRSYQKNVRQLQTQEGLLDRLERAAATQSAISAFLIGAEIDSAESLVERSTQSLETEVEQTKRAIATIVTALDADLTVFLQGTAPKAEPLAGAGATDPAAAAEFTAAALGTAASAPDGHRADAISAGPSS